MNRRPRVLLADDHTMLLDAFRRLLEPQCEIVGTACDGRALLELAANTPARCDRSRHLDASDAYNGRDRRFLYPGGGLNGALARAAG
jgi:hypothetical protein